MICLKKLFMAIGYTETTWKAARTRAVGDNKIEQLDESETMRLVTKIASTKVTKANAEKIANAQKILYNKGWLKYAVEGAEQVKEEKKNCECEALRARIAELENEVGALNMMVRFLEGGANE